MSEANAQALINWKRPKLLDGYFVAKKKKVMKNPTSGKFFFIKTIYIVQRLVLCKLTHSQIKYLEKPFLYWNFNHTNSSSIPLGPYFLRQSFQVLFLPTYQVSLNSSKSVDKHKSCHTTFDYPFPTSFQGKAWGYFIQQSFFIFCHY